MATSKAKDERGSRTQAKYLDIAQHFREAIRSARYAPNSKLPSEAEITRRFSVSRMTAVKAMQVLENDGLIVRRSGSGTFVTPRNSGSSRVFGLLIPDLGQTEIFEPICQGMMQAPSSSGHSLSWGQVANTETMGDEEAEKLCRQYVEQRVSGIFFAPLEFPVHRDINQRILKTMESAGIPVVLLDRDTETFPGRSRYDVVGLDNRRAGYLVTEHLAKCGARRIAFFARPDSAETVENRIAGYREALHAYGLPISKNLIIRGDATDASFVKSEMKLAKPDAIMCANDHTAADLMHTLIATGFKVPKDVRLAGIDDVKYARLLPVPLTTFHQPCAEIGAASLSAMLERISNPALPPRSMLLNGYLVVRSSCGSK